MRVLAVAGFVVGLAACSSPPDNGCDGDPPALSACFAGQFFADCGGDGGPRLACNDDGDCRWFSAGCVAAGYEASSCSADDVCCHDDWPFGDPGPELYALVQAFAGLGTAPWDQQSETVLSVMIDPTLAGSITDLICEGPSLGSSYINPCGMSPDAVRFDRDDDTLIAFVGPYSGTSWWDAVIEVIPEGDALRARLCAEPNQDLIQPQCGPSGRTCATSGELQINRWPATPADLPGTVLTIDATFANGARVYGSVVAPP